jgi:hypothetical protein
MADQTASLHDHALQAEKHTEALATGLAKAGASDETVKTITQCADILRQVASALAQGAEHAPNEPAPEEGPPEGGGSPYAKPAAETHQAMQQAAAKRQ